MEEMKKITQPLKVDLTFFSEEEPKNEQGESEENPEEKSDTLELTEEELKKRIDSESDRRVDKVLSRKQQEWEAETNRKIKEALEEEKRLSKLSEKEREEAKLTQWEKDIQEREEKIKRAEMRADAVADLQERDLPASFADWLLAEDAEKTLENIKAFHDSFHEAVNQAVKEKLRQDTPTTGNGGAKTGTPDLSSLAQEARIIK